MTITKTNKNSILKNLIHLLSLVLLVWSVTPYLRRNIPIFLVAIILSVWVIFAGLSTLNMKNTNIPKYFLYSFLFIGVIFGYRLIGFSSAAWGNYFNLLMFFFYSWMFYYYSRHMERKKREQLFISGMIVSLINLYSNIYILYIFPNASVELNYSRIYFNTNVGGTTFSLFSLILLIFFLVIRENFKSKKMKLLNNLTVIALIIYILQASRATSVFLMVLSILLFLFSKIVINKSRIEKFIYISFFAILSFLLLLNLNNILTILINYIENDRLELRIRAITSLLSSSGSEEGTSLVSRVQLYKLSINTFFSSIKNFLFGVGYHTTENLSVSWLFNVGIGNHSELLDTAARYGLIGLLPLCMFFNSFIRYIKQNINSNDSKKLNIVLLIFLIYSVLNNSFDPSVGVLILLMIPLFFTNKNRAINKGVRKEEAINATKQR